MPPLETSKIPPPPLFDKQSQPKEQLTNDMRTHRLWDIALSPLKQIPMNVIMMWMSGNSLSLFPLMMIAMMLLKPFQAILACHGTFEAEMSLFGNRTPKSAAFLPKLVFIFGNLLLGVMVLLKCHWMGLLPVYASDWISYKGMPSNPLKVALNVDNRFEWSHYHLR